MSKNKNIKSTYIKKNGTDSFLHTRTAGDTDRGGKGCVAAGVNHALTFTRHQPV